MGVSCCVFYCLFSFFVVFISCEDADCIAAPPCHCQGSSNIQYNGLNLTSVPAFNMSKTSVSILVLDLSDNKITKLPSDVFYNLSTTNASDITIRLNDNSLAEVEDGAFNRINVTLQHLQIQNNKLTSLPKAFRSLSSLKTLSIYRNPIKEYEISVMQGLGLTLTTIAIGADANYKWPSGLQYLFGLKYLQVFYSEQQLLPTNAFFGFEKILTQLQIEYTGLSSIPRAICRLTNLESFAFNFNEHLSSTSDLLPTCTPPLSSVRTAILVGNGLEVFPAVFVDFPALTTLKVMNNSKLVYIDETVTDGKTILVNLDISFNGFEQFPESLKKLEQLQSLNLAHNKIETIESSNIPNITFLKTLDLSYNPLAYVSLDAFTGVKDLEVLKMDGVALREFPQAVKILQKLKSLSMDYNKITCSCSMAWILTEWKDYDKVSINGNCGQSSLSLEDYIVKYLPACPKL